MTVLLLWKDQNELRLLIIAANYDRLDNATA